MEEREQYRIQYVDNTFQPVLWTQEEFDYVFEVMQIGKRVVAVDKCIFRLDDIRTITFIPNITPEEQADKKHKVIMQDGTPYEKEVFDLLVEQGFIDPDDVVAERMGD